MSDLGVAAYYSSTTPLLLNEDFDRLSQECVKDVSPEEQDSFQCQCQAWRPSLSKVSFIVTPLFLVFFSLVFFVLGLCFYFLVGKK